MHKQTLKNLRDFLTNTTFSQFCEIVYPDFKQDESTGYLKSKYSLFQQNFGFFLSELNEKRLGRFASAIPEGCDSCVADAEISDRKQEA